MKQTAMQDLREDLILTQTSAEESLLEIENQEIREACQEVISLTLKNIIKRIDEELLEMEKQQQGYSEEDMQSFALQCVANFLSNTKNEVEISLVEVIIDRNKEQFKQFKNK